MSPRFIAAAVLLVFAAAVSASAQDRDTVGMEEKRIAVSFADGSRENYTVKWTGTVTARRWEEGAPAVPLRGRFFDSRRCRWEITRAVLRRVYLRSRSGTLFENEKLSRVITDLDRGAGSAFVVQRMRPEHCGDVSGRIEQDFANARRSLDSDFDAIVESDFATLLASMGQWEGVESVEEFER